MRYQVVSQLIRKFFHTGFAAFCQSRVLLFQFGHPLCAGAAGRLVRRHVHAADVREFFERVECHDHLNRRAVGVGDNTPGGVQGVFGVYFGNHQGNVFVHAESARIVDHQRAVLGDRFGELLRGGAARRYQRDVHAAEVVVVGEQPYGEFLAPEGVFASGAPLRTEKQQFVDGQTALFQNVHKFLANGSAGPDNG